MDALDARCNAAVTRQLMSDVPLGTFCSGGIDSSLTTAIAARHMPRADQHLLGRLPRSGLRRERLRAHGGQGLRQPASRDCASTKREYAELLPQLVWHHDLPLNFANSVHIYAVSKLARQHVTVVLTGEGADELFGGYPRYYIPRFAATLDRIPGCCGRRYSSLAGGGCPTTGCASSRIRAPRSRTTGCCTTAAAVMPELVDQVLTCPASGTSLGISQGPDATRTSDVARDSISRPTWYRS